MSDAIDTAAEEPGERAECHADEQRAQRGQEAGANRDASAVQQSREDVAAEAVGAEQREPGGRIDAEQMKPALDARQQRVGRSGDHQLHREALRRVVDVRVGVVRVRNQRVDERPEMELAVSRP